MEQDIVSLVKHARRLEGLYHKVSTAYDDAGLRFWIMPQHTLPNDEHEGVHIAPLEGSMFVVTYFSTAEQSFDTLLCEDYKRLIDQSPYLRRLRDKTLDLKGRYQPDQRGIHLVVEGDDMLCSYEEAAEILDFFCKVSQDKP